MKTSKYYSTILSTLIFLMITFFGQAQIKLHETQLETVYLTKTNEKEIVYKNTFTGYHRNLINADKINFRKEIKIAKKNNNSLQFTSNKRDIELKLSSYLKIIRKAANQSKNVESFQLLLNDLLLQLESHFYINEDLDELYAVTRKSTFNGKINTLPGVL